MLKKKVRSFSVAILIAFAIISFWRGVWGLMDLYLFPSSRPLSLLASVIIGLVVLIITHTSIDVLDQVWGQ